MMPVRFRVACSGMLVVCGSCSSVGIPVPVPGNEVFSLDCPGITPHVAQVSSFLVIGHRGAAGKAVENTLPGMATAIRDGATAVEIDLSMTRDGHVVLWHDWDPDDLVAMARQTGLESGVKYRPDVPAKGNAARRPVDELSLAELRAHYGYVDRESGKKAAAVIPTFDEFVAWAGGEKELTHVFLDIKLPEKKASLTTDMVERMERTLDRGQRRFTTVYISPSEPVWRAIGKKADGAEVAFDVDPGSVVIDDKDCGDASSRWARKRGGGYASTVHPASWGNEDWKAMKTLLACDLEARDTPGTGVRKVVAATVNDRDKMECLMEMGVDGVVTDDPALLREVATLRAPPAKRASVASPTSPGPGSPP